MASHMATDIQTGLQAPFRLHREAALLKLNARLKHGSSDANVTEFREAICVVVLDLLSSQDWHSRLGGLCAAKVGVAPLHTLLSTLLSLTSKAISHARCANVAVHGCGSVLWSAAAAHTSLVPHAWEYDDKRVEQQSQVD